MPLPSRVLSAVDFSESSRIALRMAARLARQCGAELHVVYAEEPLLSAAAARAGRDLTAETREELSRFVRDAAPGATPVLQHVATGAPVPVIAQIVAREQADLIVLGAHGMSGVTRLLFGSTTEGILREAAVSVLVVPDTWMPPDPGSDDLRGTGPLIAAYDFTAPSHVAAIAACELAARLQTSVELVHVVPSPRLPLPWRAQTAHEVEQQVGVARRTLAAVVERLPSTAPVHTHVVEGIVHQALAEAATQSDHRHPILVLGRRPEGSRGAAPGSTAYRTLGLSQVPALLHVPKRTTENAN
jgi:nucleotide-binding universal stress UspA family protein